MSDRCSIRAARIRELNDQLRCKATGGCIVMTRGIEALGADDVRSVLTAVATFNDFTDDNDPWGEHDCAVLTVQGRRIISKSITTTVLCAGTHQTRATQPSPIAC